MRPRPRSRQRHRAPGRQPGRGAHLNETHPPRTGARGGPEDGTPPGRPISPMCAVNCRRGVRSRSPRRAGIPAAVPDRRVPASRCWRSVCPACCRRWTGRGDRGRRGGLDRGAPRSAQLPPQTFSVAASLGLGGAGGRRRGAPGGDLARAPRRAVPRRLPEFDRRVLESLREPLGPAPSRCRARNGAPNSARFQPRRGNESSSPAATSVIRARLPVHARPGGALTAGGCPGPLLDRIDLAVEVPAIAPEPSKARGDPARCARGWRRRVRCRQRVRAVERPPAGRRGGAPLSPDPGGETLLRQAMQRLDLSARAYHRVLRVARTLADLAGASRPGQPRWRGDPVPAQPRLR